jgi:serine/threonine protein phosphatase PrpC
MHGLSMRCVARSEVGHRGNNEDAVFFSPRLAAVADGVGGANAGEVASRWAINQMASLDKRRLTLELGDALAAAVKETNETLRFLIDCRPQWDGMGTTLTAVALSNEGEYLVANVGDSRTYMLRGGALRRLTRDQSLVQSLIDSGAITEAEARVHPSRSVVLQALDGTTRDFDAPQRHGAQLGDRLLLCSDGASDYLEDDELGELLATSSPEAGARRIVEGALAAGSRDNVSVVLADVVAREQPGDAWLPALSLAV